jgi:hypothetical protein
VHWRWHVLCGYKISKSKHIQVRQTLQMRVQGQKALQDLAGIGTATVLPTYAWDHRPIASGSLQDTTFQIIAVVNGKATTSRRLAPCAIDPVSLQSSTAEQQSWAKPPAVTLLPLVLKPLLILLYIVLCRFRL